jgi:hypothetical protein
MEIAEDRMILIDALEYELMEKLRESGDVQQASLKLDKDKVPYHEQFPLKVVSGVIQTNPSFQENIKEHILTNYTNTIFTTYLEDGVFHEFGLVDIVIEDFIDEDEISFSALICSEFNVDHDSERAITAFIPFGNLSFYIIYSKTRSF